jgi:hypothetical protein
METTTEIKNISAALEAFHQQIGTIKKNETNPFFNSRYAPLPEILTAIAEPLRNAGLIITQHPENEHCLTTMLIHVDSGEYFRSSYKMTPTRNDPQGIGSCITYARRYAIGAILSLNIDEDDDANAASTPPVRREAEAKPVYTEHDERPWLTEEQYKKVLERITDGDTSAKDKAIHSFRMKKIYREGIEQAVEQINAPF